MAMKPRAMKKGVKMMRGGKATAPKKMMRGGVAKKPMMRGGGMSKKK